MTRAAAALRVACIAAGIWILYRQVVAAHAQAELLLFGLWLTLAPPTLWLDREGGLRNVIERLLFSRKDGAEKDDTGGT